MKSSHPFWSFCCSMLAVGLVFWPIAPSLSAATYTWDQENAGSHSWLLEGNWNTAGFPNGFGDVAKLTNSLLGNQTITLDRVITLGQLNIGAAGGTETFTLAAGTGGYLIYNGVGVGITKTGSGADTISAASQFNGDFTITNNGAGLLTLSGAMRSLTSNITFAGTGAGGTTVSGAITTAGGLIKNDSGLVILSVGNTYAGATTINGGTLRISSTTGLPIRSAVTVATGASFDLNAAFTIGSLAGSGNVTNALNTSRTLTVGRDDTNTTFSGQILPTTAGNILISKIGAGTLTLAPTLASTYTGNTVINGGGINLDFANTSLTSLLAATPLQITGGNFTMTGKAGLAANQLMGALTVGATGGRIELVAGDAAGTTLRTGAVTATASGGTLRITAPANTNFQMGTAYANVGTSGTTGLNNRLVFSDGTPNVFNWASNGGVANANTVGFTPTEALPVAGGGLTTTAYILSAGQTQTTAASTIRSLKLSSTGNGIQTLDLATFNMTLGGTATVSPGAILIDGTDGWNINGSTGVLGQATTAGGDLIFHQYSAGGVTVNAGIANGAGTLNLVKAGTGLLTLAGTNTFTGTIFVNEGTLSFSNAGASGAGTLGLGIATAVTIRDGATLQYTGATATMAAGTTANSHTFVLQGGNGTIEVTDAAAVLTLNGAISGAGGYTKSGPGTLVTGASSSFTGPLYINDGILRGGSNFQVSSSTSPVTVGPNGTLDINGTATSQTMTIGSLAGSGIVTNSGASSKTFSVGGDNTSTTFSGSFTGAAGNALTKIGSGIFTLTSSSTSAWTGATTVSGGTLKIDAINPLNAASSLTIGNVANTVSRLEIAPGASQTFGGTTAVTFYGTTATSVSNASIWIGAGGTLTLGGNITYNGTGVSSAPLQPAVILGDGNLSLNATRTFTVNDSVAVPTNEAELTLATPIVSTGAFGFTKSGLGNLLLTRNNTYTGTTTINSGAVFLDYTTHNNAKLGTGALALLGGSLVLNGNAVAATIETITGNTTFAAGGAAVITMNPGAGQNLLLNLGTLTRAAGAGTVRFNLSGTSTASNGITTSTALTNGLAGSSGFATVNDGTGTYFATKSGNNIVALISTDANDVSAWSTGVHATDVGGFLGTLASTTSINSLRFNADAASTVTIASGQALGILTGGILQTSNVSSSLSSISGGKLTSGASSELIFTLDSLSQPLVVSSTITGIDQITKSGNGTLRLSGDNNSSGTVRLHAGTLELTGGNAIGDNAPVTFLATGGTVNTLSLLASQTETIGTLSGGSTANASSNVLLGANSVLTVNQLASGTYSGLITGDSTTTFIKVGASNLTYQGNSSLIFTGKLDIQGGGVILSGSGVGRLGSTNIVLNGGELQSIQDQSSSQDRIANTAVITMNNTAGTNGLLLNASNNGSRSDTIGTIALGAGQNVITLNGSGGTSAVGTLTVGGAVGLTRDNNATALVRGRSLGASSGQRGQLVFTNAPTGALAAVGGGGAGASTTTSIFPYLIGQSTSGTPGAADLGNSFVMNTGATNGLRPLVLTEGVGAEYIFNEAGFNGMGASTPNNLRFNVTPGATLNAAGGGTRTINALAIDSTAGAVTVSGPGADTLALTAGALLSTGASANNTSLTGFSGITTATGEYVVFVTNDAFTLGSPLTTSAASLTKGSAGALILNGLTNSYTNGTYFNQGLIEADTLGALGTGSLNFFGGGFRWAAGSNFDVSSRTVLFGSGGAVLNTNGNDVTLTNAIGSSGSGSLTKSGLGKLTLNTAADYTGDTFVTEGTLAAGGNNAISSSALTVSAGGTFDLGGFTSLLSNLTLAAGADNGVAGAGTLTVTGQALLNQGSIAPVLAGTMNLFKQTAGQTVVLSNEANTFTGYTHVQNGTLSIPTVANIGVVSPLGAPTGVNAVIRLGNGTTNGMLDITGTAGSTNRPIDLTGTTGGGVIANNGSALLTLAGNITSTTFGTKTLTLSGDTTGFNNAVSGVISNGLGTVALTKAGAGTWQLTGTHSFTGAVTVTGGMLTNAGTINNTPANSAIGNTAATTGVLHVPATGSFTTNNMTIGNNATGQGSLIIQSGSVTTTGTSTSNGLQFGNGGYGGVFLNGGTLSTGRLEVSSSGAETAIGVLQMSSGTLNNSEWFLFRNNRHDITITGGTLDRTGATQNMGLVYSGSATALGVMTVAGGTVINTGKNITFGQQNNNTALATGIVNLIGGTLKTDLILTYNGSGSATNSFINFNGGTLQAQVSAADWIGFSGATGSSSMTLRSFAGGAILDTNAFNVTLTQPILAPTGNGVTSIALTNGGSGFTGAPVVQISGDGSGATAYATVELDPASINFGKVTGIVVTNPGVGYTTAPVVTLVGGGGSGYVLGTVDINFNVSGGLTKMGNGTLTLTGANNFTGATLVNGGTLSVAPGALSATSHLHVGATGDASFDLFQDGVGAALVMATHANLTLGSASSSGALGFELGTLSDTITLSGTGVLTIYAGSVINVNQITGFGAGTYSLVTGPNSIVGGANLALGSLPGGYLYNLDHTSNINVLNLVVTAAGSGNLYWRGDVDSSWANFNGGNTNWSSTADGLTEAGYTPASGDIVYFSASNAGVGAINTTLDNSISIKGLKVLNSGTGAVTIAPGVGGNLTIGVDGIEIQAGAPALTVISAPVALGAAQTWSVADAGSTLRLSGALSGDFDLTKDGTGTLVIDSAATRSAASGTTTLSAGTLRLEALTALTTGSGIGMSLNGGKLSLARDANGTFNGVNSTVGGNATIEVDRLTSGAGVTLTVGSLSIGAYTLNVAGGSNAISGNMQLTTGAASLTGNAIFNVTNNGLGATTTLSIPGITESPAASGFGFTKDGDGILINTGTSNAYTGQVVLNAGVLRVSGDTTTGLGTGNATLTINGGELQLFNSTGRNYGRNTTIAGNTTITLNRNSVGTAVTHTLGTLAIGSQDVLVQAGSNATAGNMGLTFGATTLSGSPTFEVNTNGLGSVTVLTLGALNDGGTARTITKTGSGLMVLGTAASSLVNGTSVSIDGGRLNATNAIALGNQTDLTVASSAIFGPTVSQTLGALNGAGTVTLTAAQTLTVGSTNNLNSNFSGAFTTTTGGLLKAGTGTLTLTGQNLYTGATTVNNGTLLLDFDASPLVSNIISDSSALVLGGGTLSVVGDALASSQTFASTSLTTLTQSQIQTTVGVGGLSLNLGVLTRNTASALNFSSPGSTDFSFTGAAPINGVITSPNGVAFATVNNNDWANLSGSTVVAASYATNDFSAPVNHVDVTTTGGWSGSKVNTLRFNTGAPTLTLTGTNTLSAGGLLVGTGSGAVTISGAGTLAGSPVTGTVIAPVVGELGIFQNSASTLTISSAIVNNVSSLSHLRATPSGTTLNKFGEGTLILSSNRNAYTGGTNIVGGILKAGAANVIPSGFGLSNANANLLVIGSAATFDLNGFTQTIAGLSGAGVVDNTAAGAINLILGDNDGGGTFTGTIQNAAGTISLIKTGTGTQTLVGQNSYSGSTTVNRGTLALNFNTAGAPLTNILPSTGLILGTGTLNVTGLTAATLGNSQTFSGTTLAGGAVLTLAGTTSGQLTVNLGAIIRNAGSTLNITGMTASRIAQTSNANNTAGILGGGYVVAGADWAVNDLGNIVPLALGSYTTLTVAGGGTSSATNFLIGSSLTLTSAVTANSLKITTGTLTLGSNAVTLGGAAAGGAGGGLLATASATITGTGTLSAGTGNELIVYVASGTLAINTPIGGGALTISGGGTVTLGAANTLNGMITVNNATLTMDDVTRYGSATGITLNGGTLNWNDDGNLSRALTLGPGGGTINQSNDGARVIGNTTAMAFTGNGPRTLTLGSSQDQRIQTLPMVIGNANANSPTSLLINGSGDNRIWSLSGANTYAGTTTLTRGTLRLTNANNIPGGLSSSATTGNIVFAATGTNRAILETGTAAGAITRSLGYGPGQIHWEGNGGFSNQNIPTQIVNLGGAGATLNWGVGGFVPTGSALQFFTAPGNGLSSQGAIDFQNAIDLGSSLRQVNVNAQATTENYNILGAILSGDLSASAGGGLEKAGIGKLILAGNNTGGLATVTLTAGALVFNNASAIPGTGANITLSTTAGGNTAIGMVGDTNPFATFAGRIANPETATSAFLLGADSDVGFDFSAHPNMRLAGFAFSTLVDGAAPTRSVHYTGTITPAGATYRFGGLLPNTGTLQNNSLAAATALVLPRQNSLTGANALDVSVGALSIVAPNDFTGGTTLNPVATGYAAVGIGHDAALGTGGITLVGIGNNAAIGAVNGDHMLANNISFGTGQTVSLVLGANWYEGLPVNSGRGPTLTVLGTIDLNGRSNPTFTNRIAGTLVLGDVTDSTAGGAGLTVGQSTGGYYSWLATAANAGVPKTYTGLTTLSDNLIMVIDSANSLGTSGDFRLNSSTIQLQPGTASVTLPVGRNFVNNPVDTPVFNAPLASTLIIGGTIAGSTTGTPTKSGLGTVIIQGDATAAVTTGALLVNAGTLVLDAATLGSRVWTNSAPLTLGTASGTFGNGGKLQITGTFAHTFGAVAINPRSNEIQLTGAMPLALGAITRATGSSLNFAIGASGATIASTTTAVAGLVNGGTTWDSEDFAGISSGSIVRYASYTALAGSLTAPTLANSTSANYHISSTTSNDVSLAATGIVEFNTLKFSDTNARTIDVRNGATPGILQLGSAGTTAVTRAGGILMTPDSGALTIGIVGTPGQMRVGTAATANSNGDLVFLNNSANLLTINSAIVNNGTGATALTFSGSGEVYLAGANTFTGAIILNSGTLSVPSVNNSTVAGPLGQKTASATDIVLNGGTIRFDLATDGATNHGFTVNAPSGINVVANTLTLNTTVLGVATANAHHNTQNVGLLRKTGAGTLELKDLAVNANNANLSMEVAEGTLILNKTTTAAISAVDLPNSAALIIGDAASGSAPTVLISGTGGNQISDASSIVIRGDQAVKGILDLNGRAETIDGLAGSGIVTSNVSGTTIFTLGGNNSAGLAPYTLASAAAGVNATGLNNWFGEIQDGGVGKVVALTKVGSGTQIISAMQSYSGATTISAGSLKLGIVNALPSGLGKGDVTIEGTNTGTATGSANRVLAIGTLDLGGFDQDINGLNSTTGGVVVNNPTLGWNGTAWVAANTSNTLTLGKGDANGNFNGLLMDGYTVAPGGAGATSHVGTLALAKTGNGTQVISGANTYTGGSTLLGGRLEVNNTTGSGTGTGNVTVSNAGSTLGGTGTLSGGVSLGADTLIDAGSGANGIGQLTVGQLTTMAGATLKYDVAGPTLTASTSDVFAFIANPASVPAAWTASYVVNTTTHDQLYVSGTAAPDLPLGTIVSFGSGYSNGFNPVFGDVFHLLNWATLGTNNINTSPNDLVFDLPTLSGGYTYDTSAFSTHGIVVITPEPSRAMLVLIGLLGVFCRRRRVGI